MATILLPPGVGDAFWCLTKMEALIEREGLGKPDVLVCCDKDRWNGHLRSFPFLELFPFLNATWETIPCNGVTTHIHSDSSALLREAYNETGRTVFRDVLGADYFMSYNGQLTAGVELSEADGLETNWNPPMIEPLGQKVFREYCQREYGDYIVFFWVFVGTFEHWSKEFPPEAVVASMKELSARFNARPVLLGAEWDVEEPRLSAVAELVDGLVDLRGKTSVPEALGLMQGAKAIVGHPAGMTMLGASMGVPSLLVWNRWDHPDVWWRCVNPKARGETYHTADSKDLTPSLLGDRLDSLLSGGRQEVVYINDGLIPLHRRSSP